MRKIDFGQSTGILANLAQVVSAAAVVISLLYVGYQIRQNTDEIRSANRQELISRAMSATIASEDPERARIITKMREGEPLTAVEMTQAGYVVRTVLYDVQEAFFLHREGRLDDGYWNTRAAIIIAYLQPTVARDIYRRDKTMGAIDPDFAQWLDGALKERYGD